MGERNKDNSANRRPTATKSRRCLTHRKCIIQSAFYTMLTRSEKRKKNQEVKTGRQNGFSFGNRIGKGGQAAKTTNGPLDTNQIKTQRNERNAIIKEKAPQLAPEPSNVSSCPIHQRVQTGEGKVTKTIPSPRTGEKSNLTQPIGIRHKKLELKKKKTRPLNRGGNQFESVRRRKNRT